MLAAVQVDPFLSVLVVLSIGIILISFVFKLLKQPYVIAYILVGILMGPFGLKLITDESLISNLGSFGMVLLLFFIGMEISLPKLIANWRIPVLGTLIQVAFSLGAIWVIGYFLQWSFNQIMAVWSERPGQGTAERWNVRWTGRPHRAATETSARTRRPREYNV